MKSIRSSSLFKVLVLAIGVLGASVSSAHAQTATGTSLLPTKPAGEACCFARRLHVLAGVSELAGAITVAQGWWLQCSDGVAAGDL